MNYPRFTQFVQRPASSKSLTLRACGVGDVIDLTQIVVCGDQSAGKSSVLESLTRILFPGKKTFALGSLQKSIFIIWKRTKVLLPVSCHPGVDLPNLRWICKDIYMRYLHLMSFEVLFPMLVNSWVYEDLKR